MGSRFSMGGRDRFSPVEGNLKNLVGPVNLSTWLTKSTVQVIYTSCSLLERTGHARHQNLCRLLIKRGHVVKFKSSRQIDSFRLHTQGHTKGRWAGSKLYIKNIYIILLHEQFFRNNFFIL